MRATANKSKKTGWMSLKSFENVLWHLFSILLCCLINFSVTESQKSYLLKIVSWRKRPLFDREDCLINFISSFKFFALASWYPYVRFISIKPDQTLGGGSLLPSWYCCHVSRTPKMEEITENSDNSETILICLHCCNMRWLTPELVRKSKF